MKTNTDILLNLVFTIASTVLIFAVVQLNKDNKTMRAEINELRLLFNQKFLQEMVTDKPQLRTLEYRSSDQPELIRIEI